MFAFQLREKFVGLQRLTQDFHLPLHGRKVAWHQLVQRVQARALFGAQPGGIAGQRLGREHAHPLIGPQRVESHLEGETPQGRFVEFVEEVGGADEDAGKTLHALQHLVDLGDLIVAFGQAAAAQEAVGFVQQQHGAFGVGLFEHARHVLLGFADVLAGDVAGLADHQRALQRVRDVLGQRGLAGARRAMETQRAVASALQRLHDARHLEARFDVQQREVVFRHDHARTAFGTCAAQRPVGVAELAFDQRFKSGRCGGGFGVLVLRQPCKTHGGANLRRCQRTPFGESGDEAFAHRHPGQRARHQTFARAGRRALQQQVVLEAAAESGVDLLDAVGDPDHRHRVGFQDLVDPGLAADAAAHAACGAVTAVEPRDELSGFAADGREHVFHLVEQQRHAGAALEENLADLQAAVAVPAGQAVAVAVGVFHFIQVQAGGRRAHFRQLGLARAGWSVEQHVDARLLAQRGVLQQRCHDLHVFFDKGEVGGLQIALWHRAREDRHQLARRAVLAHQHRRQLFADFHQVRQVGDVLLGDQVFDHADAFQARTRTQGIGHIHRFNTGHGGECRIGFLRVADLEFHQQPAQVALVARQRAVQQQCALGRVQLQQASQGIDVLLHQRRLFLQPPRQPVAGGGQHGEQVFRRVLDVLVDVEEKRAFLIGPAPRAVALKEGFVAQGLVALPLRIAFAALAQEGAHTRQHRLRPHEMAAHQRQQAVPVAPQVEAPRLAQREGEHEVRTQHVHHWRLGQPGRQQAARLSK